MSSDGENPRICQVAYALFPSDPRVRKETASIKRRGYEVHVVCLRGPGELRSEVVDGIRVIRLPMSAVRGSRGRYLFQYVMFGLLVAAHLAVNQMRWRYAIVHIHSLPDFLVLAGVPCRLLGAKLILDLHESMPELYLARFPSRRRSVAYRMSLVAQRLSGALASRIVTINDYVRDLLIRRGVSHAEITIIENAPDWQLLPDQDQSEEVHGAAPLIVIAGGLNQERDLDLVFRAAARVRTQKLTHWRIVGSGDPAYVRFLRRRINELGIDQMVTIESPVRASEVPALLQLSTIGVVSYEKNPLTEVATPNKAYDYAMAAKAMVVADLPGLRGLLAGTVLYYTPGDEEDLAHKILTLLSDSELRRRLGNAAKARIAEHSWPIMESRLTQLYSNLTSGESSPLRKRRGSPASSQDAEVDVCDRD